MTTKEHDLKMRLVAVVQDLGGTGRKDPKAVWMIGSLAATLIDKAKASSWRELKDALGSKDYDKLLADFIRVGNTSHQAGEEHKAYACQTLGISLVCRTQRDDPQFVEGELLLDRIIGGAVEIYRRTTRAN